ncbi:MAG: hypothetical protein WCT07_00065 [Candidatus Paceibacterota bacterium]
MPKIKVDEIIYIGEGYMSPKAQIVRIYKKEEKDTGIHGDVEVVYHQNGLKGIKEDAVWDGTKWNFKNSGPSGSYVNIDQYPDVKQR